MTRLNTLLVVVVLAELAAGAWLVLRPTEPPGPPPPPRPDLTTVDPGAAAEIDRQIANCTTPAEWAALGETYLAYGFFPEAEACYRHAADQDQDNPVRAHEWAFAVERLGRLTEANEGYERAARLGHPDQDGCWYYVGRNHLRMRDTAAARAAFERAGNQSAARYELARLLVRDGKLSEAIPALDRLAAEYPYAVHPPLLRHKIEVLRGGATAAVYADRANRMHPRPGDPTSIHLPTPFDRDWKRLEDAHDRLGAAKELRQAEKQIAAGNWPAAEPRLREVCRDAWDPSAADLLVEVECLKGRPGNAVPILQDAIDRAGPSAHLLVRLGDACAEANQPAAAVAAWERAAVQEIGDSGKNAHYRLATHFEKTGATATARAHHARAWLGAGHEVFWAGNYGEARMLFEKAVGYDPQLAAGWFYLGESHRLTGRPDDARKAYKRCLAIDPDFGRARTGLALLALPK